MFGPRPGDYGTPERHVPETREFDAPTQAVQALGRESWGYRSDEDYYSDRHIIESIDRVLAMGGDYILNVGPKADGSLPEENLSTLAQVRSGATRSGLRIRPVLCGAAGRWTKMVWTSARTWSTSAGPVLPRWIPISVRSCSSVRWLPASWREQERPPIYPPTIGLSGLLTSTAHGPRSLLPTLNKTNSPI